MERIRKERKPDLIDNLVRIGRGLKILFVVPVQEIYLGFKRKSMPTYLLLMVGIFCSASLFFYWDYKVLALFGKRSVMPGLWRDILGVSSIFWGFIAWGYHRTGLKFRRKLKLDKAFTNACLETKLKELPQFLFDEPIDEFTRRLRVRGRGIPLKEYIQAKEKIESGLNVTVAKIENPNNNRELVDVIYTTARLPDFWALPDLSGFRDFSIPIGRSYRGEIRTSFRKIPHLLIAGESGGGKSSFIRMALAVLLSNNSDIEVIFLDFKSGMENQVFSNYDNITLIDTVSDAQAKLVQLKETLDSRMRDFKAAKATSLEAFNRDPERRTQKEKRIIVVVDEMSELIPTVNGKFNSSLGEINSILNRIARMGRAVGINMMLGIQKPDAKNLDPTIKANLSGILCFAVTHFSQSMVVLGNGRAAELNADFPGRAIWKSGAEQIEVQTPFLTEAEVVNAKHKTNKYWGGKDAKEEKPASKGLNTEDLKENSPA